LGRSASVAAADERFERLLASKIGADRAPKAIKAVLTVPSGLIVTKESKSGFP
jgi:hypothetical protein